MVALQKWFFQ
jgi:hypothetical protein